jgi:hypothetical protein
MYDGYALPIPPPIKNYFPVFQLPFHAFCIGVFFTLSGLLFLLLPTAITTPKTNNDQIKETNNGAFNV